MSFMDEDKQRAQNPFTDSDLKQLKAFVKRHELQPDYTIHTANNVMEALLARLEAAEAVIADVRKADDSASFCIDKCCERSPYQAWRKACGK